MPCALPIFPSKVRKSVNGFIRRVTLNTLLLRAVMWNDLELYHHYRDFTVDPVTYPAHEMRDFIRSLVRQPVLLVLAACRADVFLQRANEQHCMTSLNAR